MLQSTKPDNDILLYWPIHDFWHNPRGLRSDIRVHNSREWLDGTDFGRTAKWLDEHGYKFDYISDRQLAGCSLVDGMIQTPGGRYAVLVVPGTRFLPIETSRNISKLAEAGANVVSHGQRPGGTPGMKHREEQAEFESMSRRFMPQMQPHDGYSSAPLGEGQIVLADDLEKSLTALDVRHESWSSGDRLRFHRRAWSGGHVYFIKNDSPEPFDGSIAPAVDFTAAVLMDPLDGKIGAAEVGTDDGKNSFRVQLAPHQSLFVKTFNKPVDVAGWKYRLPAGEPTMLDGPWQVEFIAGGPELPPAFVTGRLASWTELAAPEGERFAGTARYSTRFTPDARAERYLFDLGQVADSARVELNGKPVATLLAPPFQVEIGPLHDGENLLTIEVTNVAANRVRDLDRRRVPWKVFKDINVVNISYRPFDASDWPVREAGLLGPVTVTPLAP
jgi:hypothetical protein